MEVAFPTHCFLFNAITYQDALNMKNKAKQQKAIRKFMSI